MKRARSFAGFGCFAVFCAAFLLCFVSGLGLFFNQSMNLERYFILKQHVVVGIFLLVFFLPVSLGHVIKFSSPGRVFLLCATFFVFYLLLFAELRPMEAFLLSCCLAAFIAVRFLPLPQEISARAWHTGILCWLLLNMLISTGVYMAGPMKSFRTDFFNHVHLAAAFIALPLVIYHFLAPNLVKQIRVKAALACLPLMALSGFLLKGINRGETSVLSSSPSKSYHRYNFKNPKTCGETGCHSETYKAWKISSHRLSGVNPVYRKTLRLFAQEKGETEALFCERCHNPDRFIFKAEAKDPGTFDFFRNNGISCLSCHLIASGDTLKGDGKFSPASDISYLPGYYSRTFSQWRIMHNFIRLDLRLHRKNYQRSEFYKSSEFCSICHSLTIPSKYNNAEPVFLAGPYPSWKKSVYAKEGITCAHCHLQLFEFKDPQSIERPFHARPDHRMLGLNRFPKGAVSADILSQNDISKVNADTQKWALGKLQVSRYEQLFLRYTRDGRYPAYVKHFKNLTALGVDIQPRGGALPGRDFCFSVISTNQTVGHDFPGGLFDMIQVWLEVEAKDAKEAVFYQSGFPEKDGSLSSGTHTLGAEVKNSRGEMISNHRVWEMADISNKRVIPPKESVEDHFCFGLPQDTVLPVAVSAKWLYRRCRPALCDWVFNGDGKVYPVTVVGEAQSLFPAPLEEGKRIF